MWLLQLLFILLKKTKIIENHIEANKFYFNSCIGKPQCRDLAGVYVPVSDSEIVYIVLWASEGAK